MTATATVEPRLVEPIRGEIFSVDRLEGFAQQLAASHRLQSGVKNRGWPLLRRLRDNGRAVGVAYRDIVERVRAEYTSSPAAEWLIDNFQVIEEQVREVKKNLPRGFYLELPKLSDGELAGYPRIYAIARAFVEHTDSQLQVESLERFIRAYQRVAPLSIGELWALATSLRLVLVENIRRLADQVVLRFRARAEADALADELLAPEGPSPARLGAYLRRMDDEALPGALLVQLISRMRDRDPADTPGLVKLRERLARHGRTADEAVTIEHQSQATAHVTISNVITSMRLTSAIEWVDVFEHTSLVEAALRLGTAVAEMDPETRGRYRHAVEELARGSRLSELEIAQRAAARARAHPAAGDRRADPGYYLISRGRADLEREVGFRPPLRQALRRAYVGLAAPGYVGTIALLTALILALPAHLSIAAGMGLGALGLFLLLALVPASDVAVAIVNSVVPRLVGPRRLAKLALRDGVPASMRTLVAVPTLLSTEADAMEQVSKLEVHFLANGRGDLRFAVLSDFPDSSDQVNPTDLAVHRAAAEGIALLNRRHGPAPDGGPRFFVLHRRRVWNEAQGAWMGWERKRGKLHELNRILRGATDTTFVALPGGQLEVPSGVRFVITLDADTRMPQGAVVRLVGALAHPLNRPVYDPTVGRVVEGHAVLQPRVTALLPEGGKGSRYHRMCSGPCGIDPYAFAISDVYQDLFGEGIYTGKGIYDVDAFEEALRGRAPENALLSHDLFEGVFARAGLVSDVEVFDDFPPSCAMGAARRHRWARGDWQLLPWILGRVSPADRAAGRSPIPAIGRWKMIDNLRRTLVAPSALATLVAAFCLPSGLAFVWIGFVLATLLGPQLRVLGSLVPTRRGIAKRAFLRGAAEDVALAICQCAFSASLLAYEAWLMSHAIALTLVRVYITRTHLLEWLTAARAHIGVDTRLRGLYRCMAGGVVLALGALAIAIARGSEALPAELALAGVWLIAPLVAQQLSAAPRPVEAERRLTTQQERLFRSVGRRTWGFFEAFVGAEDNALPPDNFQDSPTPEVAHRTSPTNVGLYLLSAISAYDLGWLGKIDLIERLEATFTTLERLATHRGHLYNWYDTRTLVPLEPRYISTVDSGNLSGHLIAVRWACLQLDGQPMSSSRALAGLRDTVALVRDEVGAAAVAGDVEGVGQRRLDEAIARVEALLVVRPGDLENEGQSARFAEVGSRAEALAAAAQDLADERGERAVVVLDRARALCATVASHARDVRAQGGAPGTAGESCADLSRRTTALAARAHEVSVRMDFAFLFEPKRKLFVIGYNVTERRADANFYDLLASEARLTSFVEIARGVAPPAHWFRLGRPLTPVGAGSALVSWSGSMFEYLMPELVMSVPYGSLLGDSDRLAVARQIRYCRERGVPWGVSESACNLRDRHFTYQYSNFGVDGLALKHGVAQDLVVAPYATALAAMVVPAAAAKNMAALTAAGALGRYGYFDAIDFTRKHLPANERSAVVRAYMAHHQGMTIVALANVLTRGLMRARFLADPVVQAAQLLLQERTPRDVVVARPSSEAGTDLHVRDPVLPVLRRFQSPHDTPPRTHLLSNGRYSVMLTTAGSGYSRWQGLAVTRWREDSTRDPWGSYLYLRDIATGAVWSATHQPTRVEAGSYTVEYDDHCAVFRRRDHGLATSVEVIVSPEDDAELRRVSITNHGRRAVDLELTSYAEVVLASPASDLAHPAFSNLFVQTEFVQGLGALLATRRPRSLGAPTIWAAHMAVVDGSCEGPIGYESSRATFLGRGRDPARPSAIHDGVALSNTVGSVLDPILSLRCRVRIPPGGTTRVTFSTLVARSREEVVRLSDKCRSPAVFERTTSLAWVQAQARRRHLGISQHEAQLFQRLATRIIYSDLALRAPREVLARNGLSRSSLWGRGISGDRPIVLVRIDAAEDQAIVLQLLRAQEYWRMRGLEADLVILNEQVHSYDQSLQSTLERFAHASAPASVFVLKGTQVSAGEREFLMTAARVVLRHGTLSDQVVGLLRGKTAPLPRQAVPPAQPAHEVDPPRVDLEFWNGIGGFAEDGREYVSVLRKGQWTPAPWVNVIANPSFGFVVSESGAGYTWSGNSRENQLTTWSNDAVSDPPGEVIFVRDDATGETWGPTALPIREETPYVIRHGQGYTRFAHDSHGIALELVQFVPREDPIKVSILTITNRTSRRRALSVVAYAEWVLGASRQAMAPYVITSLDDETKGLFARCPWSDDFGGRVAFLDLAGRQATWTCDRAEFIGRNGALSAPAGLARGVELSGRTGGGLDPCGALAGTLELAPGETARVVVFLGQAADETSARELIVRYRAADPDALLADVRRQWDDILGSLVVKTPDRALDIMLNRWLLYQTLACRVWARSGFYQAGGAYGFRDQLQDVMALMVAKPGLARSHLLRAGQRQFPEGDVQHWWHPPTGKGVRTRISDDLLFLPYVAAHYVRATGDAAVLDEVVPFLDGPVLEEGQHETYFEPKVSADGATLYEHCARAIDKSLATGAHGLPLMGTGDWNDGMNFVGQAGKGESVWLAWFLIANLEGFAPTAEGRGEVDRARSWRAHARALKEAVEREAWDGEWYRRAFFDDGAPIGSSTSLECQIDSIAQSWGVLSGAADPARSERAMASLERLLVRREEGLVLLLTPPFDRSARYPGYIMGYLPGIRENGGQYTHAAVWALLAFAARGEGDKATELFGLLSPIARASTPAGVERYRVEPYVVAGDVYANPPHVGRGGWTWYTGSAGWLYRAGVEAILGLQLQGHTLLVDPCIPRSWPRFELTLRHGATRYEITVTNPAGVERGVAQVTLDGQTIAGDEVSLVDDGATHVVVVRLGPRSSEEPAART